MPMTLHKYLRQKIKHKQVLTKTYFQISLETSETAFSLSWELFSSMYNFCSSTSPALGMGPVHDNIFSNYENLRTLLPQESFLHRSEKWDGIFSPEKKIKIPCLKIPQKPPTHSLSLHTNFCQYPINILQSKLDDLSKTPNRKKQGQQLLKQSTFTIVAWLLWSHLP